MKVSPGTLIERYTILEPLGTGGMATVWLARHERLGSLHALKVLEIPSPEIRERLVREGQVQGQVRHPNILSVTDVLEHEQCPCLLMELVTGPPLDTYLRARVLTLDQLDDLARQILAGVAAAHAAGLVHRDLKPANVLLQPEDERCVPKVADFGLAKVLSSSGSNSGRTRSGMAMGTPAYMAPEQIRDSSRVDARADVFSLGALLYQLTTGERPFDGEDTFEIFQAVTQGKRKPVLEHTPHLPERMVRAIEAALSIERDERPDDAAALREIWVDGTAAPEAVWSEDALTDLRELGHTPSHTPSFGQTSFRDSATTERTPSRSPSSNSEPTFIASPDPSEPTFLGLVAEPEPEAQSEPEIDSSKSTWNHSIPSMLPPRTPLNAAADPTAVEPAHAFSLRDLPLRSLAAVGALIALAVGGATALQHAQNTRVETFYVERIGFHGGAITGLGTRLSAPSDAPSSWEITTVGGRLTLAKHVNTQGAPMLSLPSAELTRVQLAQEWTEDRVSEIDVQNSRGVTTHSLAMTPHPTSDGDLWTWKDPAGHPATGVPLPGLSFLPRGHGYHVLFDDAGRVAKLENLAADLTPAPDTQLRWALRLSWTPEHNLAQLTSLDASGSTAPDHRGVVTERYTTDAHGHTTHTERRGLGDLLVSGTGGWAIHTREHDEQGRLVRERFTDADDALVLPTGDQDGTACGDRQLHWSPTELNERCFGPDGDIGWTRDGWHMRRVELNELGYPTSIALFGAEGMPVRAATGAARWSVVYDQFGSLKSEGPFYGPLDTPILNQEGWARRELTRDDNGFKSQALYLDLEGRPTSGPLGAPIERFTYRSCLELASTTVFDASSKPVLGREGWHEQTIQSTDDHRLITSEHRNTMGELTTDINGIMRWSRTYDERLFNIARSTLNAEGELALDLQGYAAARYERDNLGRAVSISFVDAEGQPMVPRDQEYAINRTTWDARGNPVRIDFFDPKNQPVGVSPLGGSSWVQTFDGRGQLIELELRDEDDRLLDGCTRIRYGYDLRGRSTSQGCFDRVRAPVLVPGTRWHGFEIVWDALDRKVLERFVDVAQEPVRVEAGYAQHRYSYATGTQRYSTLEVLDEHGELIDVDGVAREEHTLSSTGKDLSITWFNAKNEPSDAKGMTRTEWVYNDRDNEIERRYFLADGTPGRADGVAVVRFRNNERGQQIWMEFLGTWGQRMLSDEGWHAKAVEWDQHGKELSVTTYDVDLKAVATEEFSPRVELRRDTFGNISEEVLLQGDRTPALGPDGWHRRRIDRDSFGQPLETWVLGLDGLPVNDVHGVHRTRQRWARFDELQSTTHFDREANPAADASGVHDFRRRFDTHQRVVEETYVDASLAPVVGPAGFARRTVSYDYQGQVVQDQRFDAAGRAL